MYTHILNMYSKKSTRDSTKMLRIIPVKYHMLIIIVTNLWFRKMDEELGCIDNVHIHNEIKSHIRIYSIYWQHTLYGLWLNNGLNGSNIDKKQNKKGRMRKCCQLIYLQIYLSYALITSITYIENINIETTFIFCMNPVIRIFYLQMCYRGNACQTQHYRRRFQPVYSFDRC